MDRYHDTTALIDALEEEVALLDSFVKRERELRELVMDRNWPALERSIGVLNEAARSIEAAEDRRHRAFARLAQRLGLGAEASFYDLVSHVPQESRQDLVDLFRELKVSVMRVQGLNSGIESFVKAR
ncbi:MAG: flagellar export chaperone FlgN, partial [Spirochaetota bacterium]